LLKPGASTPELGHENADLQTGSEETTAVLPATAGGRPISLDCPIDCLRVVLPARALNPVCQLRPTAPQTVGDLVEICLRGGLNGIRNLGPRGVTEINDALTAAGLLHEHSRPNHHPAPIYAGNLLHGLPARWGTEKLPEDAHRATDYLESLGWTLAENGLDVREFHYNGVLVEVDASKPGRPDRGEFAVCYDGLLVWERHGSLKETGDLAEITKVITTMLGAD
jgi:hypothetical protein